MFVGNYSYLTAQILVYRSSRSYIAKSISTLILHPNRCKHKKNSSNPHSCSCLSTKSTEPKYWKWKLGVFTCTAGIIGCGCFLLLNQDDNATILSQHISGQRMLDSLLTFSPFKGVWDQVFAWEQSKSDDPWVLLNLTKTRNFWIRQMGVASLANKLNWDDYKYRNVAQACSPETTVALARYHFANEKFFLPPPRLHDLKHDLVKELQLHISKLPVPVSITSCLQYYRLMALDQQTTYQKDPLSMDIFTMDMYTHPGEDKKMEDKALRLCLEALVAYTAIPKYADMFMENQGLAALQRLLEEHSERWIQMFVATILAHVSQSTTHLDLIVRTGWIHTLRQWSNTEDSELSLIALTTLANLDQDWIAHDIYQDIVLIHPTHRNSGPVHLDVVFVHGLKGSAVQTWRQKDRENSTVSTCWPKDWLASDCPNVRIISIGYNTLLHKWEDACRYEQDKRTIEGRGKDLIEKLKRAGVGNRPIVWVGHSMGGLLIKEMLCRHEPSKVVAQTKGVILYSVPHHGAPLVDTMMYAKYLLFPSVEVQELVTSSPKLQSLHKQFCDLVSERSIPLLSFAENAKTDMGKTLPKVLVVPPESSDPGFGKIVSLQVNHINTCKPSDEDDIIYQLTVSFIRNILETVE